MRALFTLATILCLSASAFSQLPTARLDTIWPIGGKQGSTVELKVEKSSATEGLEGLLFSHPGITAVPKEANGTRVANTFIVNIKSDVPPGVYDVRTRSLYGLSNPKMFAVGAMDELDANGGGDESRQKARAIKLNTIINGRAEGRADVDWFKFEGKKGQHIIADCVSDRLNSPMRGMLELHTETGRMLSTASGEYSTDAVLDLVLPADGTYFLKVADFAYNGSSDHIYRLRLHTGPHIEFVMPPAVEPGKTSKVMLYGRNLAGGKPSGIRIDGQELVKLEVSIKAPGDGSQVSAAGLPSTRAGIDGFEYRLKAANGVSNPFLIQFCDVQATIEKEGNDDIEKGQKIAFPSEIAAQFQAVGDQDVFQFTAKKGDPVVIEVIGQRNGTTVDPYLIVEQLTPGKDGKPVVKRLTSMDDRSVPNNTAFPRSGDDPVYQFTAAADGDYRIILRDRYGQSRGDARLIYRLCVRKPAPDFRLVAVTSAKGQRNQVSPASIVLRKGSTTPVTVYSLTRDGMKDPVIISVEGLPAGVTASPCAISGDGTGTLMIRASETSAAWAGPVKIVGKATVQRDGKAIKVVRSARSATLAWAAQNNQPSTTRLFNDVTMAVIDETQQFEVTAQPKQLIINQNRQVLVPVKLIKRDGFKDNVTLTMKGLPRNSGVTGPNNTPTFKNAKSDDAIVPLFFRSNTKTGTYTIYFDANSNIAYKPNPKLLAQAKEAQQRANDAIKAATDAVKKAKGAERNKAQQRLRSAQSAKRSADKRVSDLNNQIKKPKKIKVALPTPAIVVTVRPAPCSLSGSSTVAIKKGGNKKLMIQVRRAGNFKGPVTLTVAGPPNGKGISATPVTIPADKKQGEITIAAAGNAKTGKLLHYVVRAKMEHDGEAAVDLPINLTVN